MIALTLLAGGGLVVLGWVLGRLSRKPKTTSTTPPPPNLKCGCGHHLSMHDPEKGVCNDEVWQPYWDKQLAKSMRKREACRCKQYTGDRPIERFYSPRMV